MPRPNKYLYLYVVQGNYGSYGWEDLAESESYQEARYNLKEYRISSGPAHIGSFSDVSLTRHTSNRGGSSGFLCNFPSHRL